VRLRVRVLRSIPRRAPARVRLRTGAHRTSSSPRHDRLDARIVNLSRLQASRKVAARGLAPSVEAFDTPLGPRASRCVPGVCYSALRCLPRRDSHPLETNSVKRAIGLLRHDAPWMHSTAKLGSPTRAAPDGRLRMSARRWADGNQSWPFHNGQIEIRDRPGTRSRLESVGTAEKGER
jgi:hypothetical protein